MKNTSVYSLVVCDSTLFAGTYEGVFLTTNNGRSWTNSGLENTYVHTLAISGSTVFAGTDSGVFLSTNTGKNWIAVSSNLTYKRILSFAINNGDLFAGTSAGGVWRRPLSEMTVLTSTKLPQRGTLEQAHFKILAPSHNNPKATIEFFLSHPAKVTVAIYNLSGHTIASIINAEINPGSHTYYWDTRSVANGYYIGKMKIGTNEYAFNIPMLR